MLLQKQKVLECENKLTEKQKNGNDNDACCTMENNMSTAYSLWANILLLAQ